MTRQETTAIRKPAQPKNFWQKEAVNIVKSLMTRQGVVPKTLSVRLEERLGVKVAETVLRNRLNRGNFSFVFFLQCVAALGHDRINLELTPPPPKKRAAPSSTQKDNAGPKPKVQSPDSAG